MSSDSIDWKLEIVSTFYAKRDLDKFDNDNMYPLKFPKVAAREYDIQLAEKYVGFSFDEEYRDFLRYCDGWDDFAVGGGDLFGTSDYRPNGKYPKALELMDVIDLDGEFDRIGLDPSTIYPFCASDYSSDIFFLRKKEYTVDSKVFWFAGYLIDTFPSFLEFIRSMRSYDLINVKKMMLGMN